MRAMTVADNLPLVSVVVATRNRAEMLRSSIHSVLCQTYSNLEVIVVDDGSNDHTRELVESIDDARVVYSYQQPLGISAARNLGTDRARGQWIAVHDDDDIMMPNRISDQLKYADDATDFVYGSFINFDDETGHLQLHHGRNYGFGPAILSGFAPGHSTWLVRTALLRRFRYDVGIESAVDNNLAFRMLRSGVRFRHSGVMCLLRRVHSGRITDRGGAGQKYVARLNLNFIKRGISASQQSELIQTSRYGWGPLDKTNWQTKYLPFMPDHLVKRFGYVAGVKRIPEDSRFSSNASVARIEVADAAALNWFDFMSLCSEGMSTENVWARPLENPILEDALAGVSVEPLARTAGLRNLAAAVAIEECDAADEGPFVDSDYTVLVSGFEDEWVQKELGHSQRIYLAEEDGRDVVLALVPEASYESARKLLEDRPMGLAVAYRLFSHKRPNEIREDVERFSISDDSSVTTASRLEEAKK